MRGNGLNSTPNPRNERSVFSRRAILPLIRDESENDDLRVPGFSLGNSE
jgi:hypothetical protein